MQIACSRVDSFVARVLQCLGTDQFKCFITSREPGYRFDLYPLYKANRKSPKPLWYDEIRAHLVSDYNAVNCYPNEADDALGIAQTENTVICTIDKDLDQVPGAHFDFVKEVKYEVSPQRALRFFYFQLLTGDRVDNIPGVPGIGPKKANAILEGLTTEEEYAKAVLKAYQDHYTAMDDPDIPGFAGYVQMTLMGRLLKIKQREDEELWQVPAAAVLKLALKATSNETELTTSTNPSP